MVPSILFSECIKEAFYKTRLTLLFKILIYYDFLKYDLWMAQYEIRLTFRAITLLQKNLKAKTVYVVCSRIWAPPNGYLASLCQQPET